MTVQLRNRGADAFRPAEYGDVVAVERRLQRSGSSQYRLRNSAGKEVSSRRRDLTALLDHFNIQVDNPCAVLMQDTSRQFLTDSSPRDKYKFFMVGTQLEQLKKDLVFLRDALQHMMNTRADKEALLPDLRRVRDDLRAELDTLQNLDALSTAVTELRLALAWAHVHTDEQKLAQVQADSAALEQQLEAQRTTLGMKQTVLSSEQQKKQTGKDKEVAELRDQLQQVGERKRAAVAKLDEGKRGVASLAQTARNLDKQVANFRVRIERQQKLLEKERSADSNERQREKDKRSSERRQKETELKVAQGELGKLQATLAEADDDKKKLSQAMDEARQREAALKAEHIKVGRKLEQLASARANKIAQFGEYMPRLLDLVQQEKRWHRVPVGPMGAFVTVRDPKWAPAIESSMGNMLKRFLVTDSADQRLFQQLLQRHMPTEHVPTLTQAFTEQRYGLSAAQQPAAGLLTILRAVDVSSPWVCNALIDQAEIESTVLADDRRAAEHILSQHNDRVRTCVCPDGSVVRVRGGSRMFEGKNHMHAEMLGADHAKLMTEHKNTLQKLENDLKVVSEELKQHTNEFNTTRATADEQRKKLGQQQTRINELEADLSGLRAAERESEDTKPQDSSEQEGVLKGLTEDLHKNETAREELNAKEKKARAGLAPLQAEVSAANEALEQLEEHSRKLGKDLEGMVRNIAALSAETEQLKKQIADGEARLAKLAHTAKQLGGAIAANSDKARQLGERPAAAKQPIDKLENSLKGKQRLLEREQLGKRDVNEVKRELQLAEQRLLETEGAIGNLKGLSDELSTAGHERHNQWRKWRKDISGRTRKFFNAFLTQKGHAGTIMFDHEDGSLQVEVQLDLNKPGEAARDTRSLSGGEKSFATLALLLAIWETMDTPFRAMDEFDVFMDAVRRTISIELLIKVAQQYRNRQFIFITPQDPRHVSTLTLHAFISLTNMHTMCLLVLVHLQRHQVGQGGAHPSAASAGPLAARLAARAECERRRVAERRMSSSLTIRVSMRCVRAWSSGGIRVCCHRLKKQRWAL